MTKQRGGLPAFGAPYWKNGDRSELGDKKCLCSHIEMLYSKLGRKNGSIQVAEIKLPILVWVCGLHNVQLLPLQKDKHLLVILKISFGSLIFVNMTVFLQLCLTEHLVLLVDSFLSLNLNRVFIRNICYTRTHKVFLGFPHPYLL